MSELRIHINHLNALHKGPTLFMSASDEFERKVIDILSPRLVQVLNIVTIYDEGDIISIKNRFNSSLEFKEVALLQIKEENFQRKVEIEKIRLRSFIPWYKKLFPFKIKIERISNEQ